MNIFKLQRKELKIMENNLLNNDIKPILKWVGGKRELIPIIREYYKNLSPKKYIEPFFGGGSVYLDVLKTFGIEFSKKSIINDVNTEIIGDAGPLRAFCEPVNLTPHQLDMLSQHIHIR